MKPRLKCILVADSARARLFTYDAGAGASGAPELVESEDLVSPARRRRDSELFDESRPGLRQAQRGGPRHAVDDHRDAERENEARVFAGEIVAHVGRLCEAQGAAPVLLVCSAPMLGHVRAALERAPARLREAVRAQLARDLTTFSAPQIHDWLAAAGELPPRTRIGVEPPR